MNLFATSIDRAPMGIGNAITKTLQIDLVRRGELVLKFGSFSWRNRLRSFRMTSPEINSGVKGCPQVGNRGRARIGDSENNGFLVAGRHDDLVRRRDDELRVRLRIAVFFERGYK